MATNNTRVNPHLRSYPPTAPLIWINGWPGIGKRSIAENLSGLLGLERTVVILNCNYNGTSHNHPETGLNEKDHITHTVPLPYSRSLATTPPLSGGASRAALDLRLKRLSRPYTRPGRVIKRRSSVRTLPPTSARKQLTHSNTSEHGSIIDSEDHHSPTSPTPFLHSPHSASVFGLNGHAGILPSSPRQRNPKALHLDFSIRRRASVGVLASATSNRSSPRTNGASSHDGSNTTDYFPPFPYSAPFAATIGYQTEPVSAGGVRGEGPVRQRSGTLPISKALFEANAKMSDSVRLKRRPLSVIGPPASQNCFDWRSSQGSSQKQQTYSWDTAPAAFSRSNSFTSTWSGPTIGTPLIGPSLQMPPLGRSRTYSVAGASFAPISSPPSTKDEGMRFDISRKAGTRYTVTQQRSKSKSEPRGSPPLSLGIVTLNNLDSVARHSWAPNSTSTRVIPKRLSQPVPLYPIAPQTRYQSAEPLPGRQLRPSEVQRQIESQLPTRSATPPVRESTPIPPALEPPPTPKAGRRKGAPVLRLQTKALGPTTFHAPSKMGAAPRKAQSPLGQSLTIAGMSGEEHKVGERSERSERWKSRTSREMLVSVDANGVIKQGDKKSSKPTSPMCMAKDEDGQYGGGGEEGEDEANKENRVPCQSDLATPSSKEVTPASSPLSNQTTHQTPQTSPPCPPSRAPPPPPVSLSSPTPTTPYYPPLPTRRQTCSGATPPSYRSHPPPPFSPTSTAAIPFHPPGPIQPFSPTPFSPLTLNFISPFIPNSTLTSIFPTFTPPTFAPPPPPPTRARALTDDTSHRAVHRQTTFRFYVMPATLRTTVVVATDCQTADLSGASAANSFRQAAREAGRPFVAVTLECSRHETAVRVKSMERACCNGMGPAFGGRGPRSKLRDVGVALSVRRGRTLFRFGERVRMKGRGRGSLGQSGEVRQNGGLGHAGGGVGGGGGGGEECGDGEILVDEEGVVNMLTLDVTHLEANEAAGKIWQFLADIDARCRMLKRV